jgi:hypothetical protein
LVFGVLPTIALCGVALIREPSRGAVLSDFATGAIDEASDLTRFLVGKELKDCVLAVAVGTPRF